MKKLFFALIAILIISGCVNAVKEITPFKHPLFITSENLDSLGIGGYKYIKNESTLEYSKKTKPDMAFSSTTTILPDEKTFYPSVLIDIFERGDELKAKEDFAIRESVTSKITPSQISKNYRNLGDTNIFYGYEETINGKKYFLAILIIQQNEYEFIIQVYNKSSQEKANTIAEKIGSFLLSKSNKS